MAQIDMGTALYTLRGVAELREQLDGQDPDRDRGADRPAMRAERSKQLLRAAHEADRLRLQILDEYHKTRDANRKN